MTLIIYSWGMVDNYPFHLFNGFPNLYGFSGLDRRSVEREKPNWKKKLLNDSNTRFVLNWRSKSLISEPTLGYPSAVKLKLEEIPPNLEVTDQYVFLGQKDALWYVGIDISTVDEFELNKGLPENSSFRDLREVGAILDRFDACILSYCRAIFYWQQNNKFCGVCGSKTAISKAGHQIDCKEITCRKPVFPRTDPAVIMLVYDDDRILLGRQSIWKKGMYSTLAGFLEPGETLEEAVAREVFEEANIEVEDVSYHSSQPWPFPASIMLGFYAKARSTEIRRNDEEVEDVQWFTRGEVSQFSKLGKSLPRKDSIARCLIEDWLRNDY